MQLNQFLPAKKEGKSLAPFLPKQYQNYHKDAHDQLAFMRAATKTKKEGPDNPVLSLMQKWREDKQKPDSALKQEAVAEYFEESQKALNASIVEKPPQDEDDVAAIADVVEQDYAEASREDRIQQDYLKYLAPEAAQAYVDIEADRLFFFNEMANIMEQAGNGKIVKDVAGLLLWNNVSFNSAKIAEGNYFTSAGDVKNAIRSIREIPNTEERRAAMVEFMQRVTDVTGNTFDQLDYLSRYTDERDTRVEEGLDKAAAAIDAFTVAAMGTVVVPAAATGITTKVGLGVYRSFNKIKDVFNTLRDTNVIKSAKKVGAEDEAALMSKAAMEDKAAADAMGVAQDTAAANQLPFSFEGVIPGAADGLSVKLTEFSLESKKIKELVESGILKEGHKLTPEETKAFVANRVEELKAGDEVVNVRPIEQTADGWKFEVEYTTRPNPNDATPPKFKRVMGGDFKLEGLSMTRTPQGWKLYKGEWNDPNRTFIDSFATKADAEAHAVRNGMVKPVEEVSETSTRTVVLQWDDTDLHGYKVLDEGFGAVKGFLASPNIKFFTDRLQLNMPAARTMFQQAHLKNALNDMFKQAYKPLGNRFTPKYKRSRQKLDELLQVGDQWDNGPLQPTGKVFSVGELREGVLLPSGKRVQLSEPEIESYFKVRMALDNLHHIEDLRLVETAKLRGIQKLEINGTETLAKPYLTDKKAHAAVGDNWVWNSRTNKVEPMNPEALKTAYLRGMQVVRAEDYTDITDAAGKLHSTRFMLVEPDSLKGSPSTMLNYRQGYLPKMTDDGIFFVKEGKVRNVNGRPMTTSKSTLGMFTTKKAADAYRAKKTEQAIQAAMSNGRTRAQAEKEVGDIYEVLRDREIPEGNLSDPALFGQSPFTGGRSSREIFLDEEGNMPVRVNAYEAIQRAIRHAGDGYPMSKLRHSLEQRWLASAKPYLPAEYQHDFRQAINHIPTTPSANQDVHRALHQTHSYIRHVVGTPSDAQLKTRYALQKIADKFEGKHPRIAKLFNKYAQQQDPSQLAKTITFHSLLGGFNLSQFIVQSMGSTVAMALDPVNFARSTQLSMALNALDQARTPQELAAVKKLMSKTGFANADEIDDLHRAWRKSGLMDDLLSNADYSEFSRHWELSLEALRAGTLPFRMGEAAHRRYTFANAYMKVAKGKKIDDDLLKEIMNKQIDLSMNMTRMNKASWQEGAVLGVATQFRQVTSKYLEMLVASEKGNVYSKGILTGPEKAALVTGQFILFGFHGVPAGTTLQKLIQGNYGWDEEAFDPDFQRFLNEGMMRTAMDAVGLDTTNVISRVAIGDSLTDVMDVVSVDSMLEFLGGPAVSHVGAGAWEAAKEGLKTIRFLSNPEYSYEFKLDTAEEYAAHLLSGIPVVDDATSAFWYAKGLQLDRRGRAISEDREISWAEVAAIAGGFSDRTPSDIYSAGALRRETSARIDETVDNIASKIRKRFALGRDLDGSIMEYVNNHAEYNSLNDDERDRIRHLVLKSLTEEPRLEREINEIINLLYNQGLQVKSGATSNLFLEATERAKGAVE